MRYEFRGLIFGGAYTRRGLFSEFYGISSSFKVAPSRVQVLDFANRQRDEYVGRELERSEFDK